MKRHAFRSTPQTYRKDKTPYSRHKRTKKQYPYLKYILKKFSYILDLDIYCTFKYMQVCVCFFAALFVSQSLNGAKPKFGEENIQRYRLTERQIKLKLPPVTFVMPKYYMKNAQNKSKAS